VSSFYTYNTLLCPTKALAVVPMVTFQPVSPSIVCFHSPAAPTSIAIPAALAPAPPPLAVVLAALVHVLPPAAVVHVCNPPRVAIVCAHVLPPVVFCIHVPPPTAAVQVHVPLEFSVPLLPVDPNALDLQ